jgi:glycosyltransferase involved in cell wall biosynthesis
MSGMNEAVTAAHLGRKSSDAMTARIDVVIPAFNAAKTVKSAIASIQCQTVSDIRIIVIDDGSTDDTASIVRGIRAADDRVHLLSQPNGGIAEARNAGLAECRAEFIAWLDADDLAAPDRLERQAAYLAANPDCVAVSGAHRHIDAKGQFHGIVSEVSRPEEGDPTWVPPREPYLAQPFLMVRRAAMQALGGYRQFLSAEDVDLCWRMQEIGRLHNMREVVGDFRIQATGAFSCSIVSGRILALNAALAALSTLRRRGGRPDLAFTKEKAARLRSRELLFDIVAVAAEDLTLDEEERGWLEIAVAGKMMELTAWRPFELDLGDCHFIRGAMARHARDLLPGNRKDLFRSWAGAAARLLHKGYAREALALVSPRLYPLTAARLALRAVASPGQISRLREMIGRGPTLV